MGKYKKSGIENVTYHNFSLFLSLQHPKIELLSINRSFFSSHKFRLTKTINQLNEINYIN